MRTPKKAPKDEAFHGKGPLGRLLKRDPEALHKEAVARHLDGRRL